MDGPPFLRRLREAIREEVLKTIHIRLLLNNEKIMLSVFDVAMVFSCVEPSDLYFKVYYTDTADAEMKMALNAIRSLRLGDLVIKHRICHGDCMIA